MKVLVATKNINKLKEINKIIKDNNLDISLLSLKDFDDNDEVIENGSSFSDNAYLKAKYYYDKYHLPTIGEDSGIEIKHLNNFPGIYSARFLNGLDYSIINSQILKIMENVDDRECRYVTHVCYIDELGNVSHFEDYLYGEISLSIRGNGGFGYDPIVYIKEYGKTCAELGDIKNKISHRYKAICKWVKSL